MVAILVFYHFEVRSRRERYAVAALPGTTRSLDRKKKLPTTAKRTRYGGIVGEITEVSPFAVTSETATSVVGNPELVQKIIGQEGGKVEVLAQLIRDSQTFSGYNWSSSDGPELEISPGTTTTVRVIVEERSPITFVLPILREWSGINS